MEATVATKDQQSFLPFLSPAPILSILSAPFPTLHEGRRKGCHRLENCVVLLELPLSCNLLIIKVVFICSVSDVYKNGECKT